jgi:hypothetical protein
MEHGLSMTRRLFLALLACFALPAGLHAQTMEQSLVLVANAQSAIQRLSPDETRKLYLGIPMLVDSQRIRPLRNNTNLKVQEMFMQKVMFMSTPAYERQILSRVFRMGGTRPPAYAELRDLLNALESDPAAVTYMPRELATARPGLKIVGEL